MQTKTFLISALLAVLQIACAGFSVSFNNVWKVPGTNLEIAVVKEKTSAAGKTVERKMTLRENHSDKINVKLARTENNYSRLNVYQTSENTYLVRDSFETYELNTQTKTLQKSAPSNSDNQKFVGAFDDNDNGSWRFITASERGEIPLGTGK